MERNVSAQPTRVLEGRQLGGVHWGWCSFRVRTVGAGGLVTLIVEPIQVAEVAGGRHDDAVFVPGDIYVRRALDDLVQGTVLGKAHELTESSRYSKMTAHFNRAGDFKRRTIVRIVTPFYVDRLLNSEKRAGGYR